MTGMEVIILLRLLVSLTSAIEHGVDAVGKINAVISKARKEGRDVSFDELEALADETDAEIVSTKSALKRNILDRSEIGDIEDSGDPSP